MTSAQRVMAAFSETAPDRTPLWEKLIKSPVADDLLGRPSAAENFHYKMERLADGDWEGLQKQAARDLVDLNRICGFDLIRLYVNAPPPAERPERVSATTWRLGNTFAELLPTGWVRNWSENTAKTSEEETEAAHRNRLAEPYVPPGPIDERGLLMWREVRRIMAEEGLSWPIFAASYGLGVATLPPYVLRWFVKERDLLHEHYRRQRENSLRTALEYVREGASIIGLGGDFAADHGPLCSPPDYREFVADNIALQSRELHRLDVFTTNASDGDLWPVIDDFLVTAEVDGFEEIDGVAGMDISRLKACFPDKTLIGNIDIRHILTHGTPQQVREHTMQCLEAGQGRRHILMSSNCIHEDVKTTLFEAHLQAYRDFYGL